MWQSIYHIAKIRKTFLSVKNSRDFFTYLRIKKSSGTINVAGEKRKGNTLFTNVRHYEAE